MKNYKKIVILWTIIVIFSAQKFCAELALLTIPFTLIYLIICVYYLISNKKSIKEIGIKFLIIAFSYSIVAVVHFVRFEEARSNADFVLHKIQAFKSVHGTYPATIIEMGLKNEALRKQRIFYDNKSNEPVLFYPATQVPFDIYDYNFKRSQWEYRVD